MKKEIKTLEDLLPILEEQTQVTINTIDQSDVKEIYLPQYDSYIYNENNIKWFVEYNYNQHSYPIRLYYFYSAGECHSLYKLLTEKLGLNVAIDESNYDKKLYLIDDEEKTFICDDCTIQTAIRFVIIV